MTRRTSHAPAVRGGGMVATFLRVLLLPVICIGVPMWPVVGILCAVPVVGIFAIPLFLLLTSLLLYSVAWFSYLVLAQADPPAASSNGGALSAYLPFLPYSPLRCLKINWAALIYAYSAIRVALPAVLDWSYRRVMVLGTQGGGGIVKENIPYGSSSPNKFLDVYLPPSTQANGSRTPTNLGNGVTASLRQRKHSTQFAEAIPVNMKGAVDQDATPRPGDASPEIRPTLRAPVVVVVPSPIPPLTWTQRRKTYLQLALRLRRMGYCVVVPDLTWYPEGRVNASIVDMRLVLRWTAANCKRYGGDERRIYLLGHGMSAHLAMLTLTQEAVVLSREGYLQRYTHQTPRRDQPPTRWDMDEGDETLHASGGVNSYGASGLPVSYAAAAATPVSIPTGAVPETDENSWVDESGEEDQGAGGASRGEGSGSRRNGQAITAGHTNSVAFPAAGSEASSPFEYPEGGHRATHSSSTSSAYSNDASHHPMLPNTVAAISNGLRKVEIYEPKINIPPVAGVILLAGVFDVIKCFRNESDRGVEHLSVLRRSCGPSHTACLLHSPAHLLYAAKNILDTSLLPPKFLLVHGGKDAVVDISQSTLLKTLLSGIGVENVKLRAYRELGHVEAVASLFLGMGKASTRYSKQILHDLGDFIAS